MSPFPRHFATTFLPALLLGLWLALAGRSEAATSWWDKEWTMRKKITVEAGAINGPIGSAAVLVRLHDGNHQFAAGREDGADVRFVAADDKTLLPYHLERYDALLNEAFVWVRVPDVKSGAAVSFWLYYGNLGEKAVPTGDAKATYDAETVLVYHFAESGSAPADASGNENKAENAGVAVPGSLIGGGLRLNGQSALTIPAASSLNWLAGGALTWSVWLKPTSLAPNAVLFSRRENGAALLIGLDNGVPYVEITDPAGTQRSSGGEALAANTWRHLAVVAEGARMTVYLDGESYGTVNAGLPALNSASLLGRDGTPGEVATDAAPGFVGELDELQIAKAARPVGFLQLAARSQGTGEKAAALLAVAADEGSGHGGENELAKHLTLITDISKSLTIDGWVVIVLCAILAVVGWYITVAKFIYLNRIEKANSAFLKQWEHLSSDLTAIDHADEQSVKSMGGKVSGKVQKLMKESPLYHIYHIGSEQIGHRLANAREGFRGLSGRSIQAIRATLDGGLVREVQRLNRNIVFLTIGIAGGPYLGLLGTVIGVMITFAVIAKSGEVEVNSIAPGIAGALLATVAGLAVAIPALFAYSYISTRIKDAVSEMQIFIDEFVAKIAEFYPE